MTSRIFEGGVLISQSEDPADAAWLAQQANARRIRADIYAGLDVNRQLAQQNQAIIDQAVAIEAFSGLLLTQAQIIATFKQLATGVRLLAQHDQVALAQRNYLARLALGAFDGTD